MWGDFMSKGQKAAPRSTWGNERKENQKKWQKENRTKLSADVSKETAALFRSLCADNNTAVSAALSVFVRACIDCNSLDVIRDDDGTTAAGSIQDNDGRRDDIPGRKNIDPAFPQGDQASENDTPGTVDSRPGFDTPGTVDLPTANDTHGTVG